MHDIRQAVRLFLRRPALTASAIITITVGLAATIVAFAVVDQVLLRRPPFADSEKLVMIWETHRDEPGRDRLVSPADFHDLRASGAFSSAAAWMSWNFNLTGTGVPERLRAVLASSEFFRTLAIPMGEGVVISHGLWQRAFGGDESIVGRAITLDGQSVVVTGVTPAGFAFPDEDVDVWVPLVWGKHFQPDDREGRNLRVIARVRDGVTVDQADAITRAVISRIAPQSPSTHEGWSGRAVSLHEDRIHEMRPTLLVILAAATAMLVIGCTNAIGLLLMLATSRRRELATRAALGAGRRGLLRHAIAEGVVVGSAAGVIAFALAAAALRLAVRIDLPLPDLSMDWRIVTMTVFVSLATGITATVIPMLLLSRAAFADSLRASHQIAAPGSRLRSVFVAVQVALTCALLLSSGVLVKSFHRLMDVDPGFDPRNVLTARIWLPPSYSTSEGQVSFFEELTSRLAALPGVTSVATIQDLPLRGNAMTMDVAAEGFGEGSAAYRLVSDGYFQTMNIPILRGRAFTPADDSDAPLVFVINRSLASRLFRGLDPVGQLIRIGDGRLGTVIGVAADVKQMGLDGDEVPAIYQPLLQKDFEWLRWTTIVMRTDGTSPALLAGPLRREVMRIDPNQPVFEIVTIEEIVQRGVARPRITAWIVGAVSMVGLTIALIGIAGLLSYAVTVRTRELGIRMALGARPAVLFELVLRQTASLVLPGIAAGLAIAVIASPLLQRLLFGVNAVDAVVYTVVPLALLICAGLAVLSPARRAATVDPAVALRVE
ncbi:MAG TPA: ABC transporter permease [Thermoanaerobaculia bacterium]|nr:ABC transporter permease [Thermoanaerobaculia bacterium]